jgi:hypothetical protein
MDYELYHDESQEAGYWHGILLVPACKKLQLIDYLQEARNNTRYFHPLSLKKVRNLGRIYDCADAWVQIGVASLMSTTIGAGYQIFLGKRQKGKKVYSFFSSCVGAKFILFRETESHSDMNNYPDHASKIETTFRMGLKGGLHLLGRDDEYIHVIIIHFDGHEHYGRHLDMDRAVRRLEGLRDYCSISTDHDLIDDRSSDYRRNDSQEYDDCQLLQLADLLVGSFRTILGVATKDIHKTLAHPLRELVIRYRQGYARMQKSRWRNSFCISQCYLENGRWRFETIEYPPKNNRQLSLF